FALAGAMVILCALFNYLVLFITRLKMRGRELALRKVNGASDSSLMGTLLLEFGLVLLMALFIGECMVELSLSFFKEVSRANMEPMDIYKETLFFAFLLYVITLLLCALPIYYFRRKTLYAHLHGKIENGVRNIFQKVVLVSQILMSAIMIVATTVIFLQVRYLQNQSLGLNPHNIYTIHSLVRQSSDLSPLEEKLKQLPSVDKIAITHGNFFPNCTYDASTKVMQEGTIDPTPVYIMHCFTDARLFEMAEIRLLEGRYYRTEETHEVVINESAKKLLGEKGTPGNQVDGHTIVGVVADCYTESPLLPANPTIYRNIMDRDGFSDYMKGYGRITITFKLKEGVIQKNEDLEKLKEEINDLAKDMQNASPFISSWEKSYEDIFLNSEKNLAKLFSIVSIICLLISIFGIYSLASLTCEQRRKEIAIRKINGATMKDILNLFFKEFFLLLGIALVIAFPIGYYVMNLWLEQYTRRVPMGLPLFLGVALSLALVIVASIFLRVWRAASANPAEVVKENN
ncbi:MAG: FtsX-like permease family protein, partial [Bacteroidales bacterium]|nr:FtsX-like permease family protein [Bacteroidales bacterium]